jgi:PncC family amidohydrolase
MDLNQDLAAQIVQKLKAINHHLCTVESCTGGLISNLITNVSGASLIYWGSYITYDNSLKVELGVSKQLIITHGAVSGEVATEMAECGLQKMKARLNSQKGICISTTGIAGPTGGTPEKPVGLCYISLAKTDQKTQVERFLAPSEAQDRLRIKSLFAQAALQLLLRNI